MSLVSFLYAVKVKEEYVYDGKCFDSNIVPKYSEHNSEQQVTFTNSNFTTGPIFLSEQSGAVKGQNSQAVLTYRQLHY